MWLEIDGDRVIGVHSNRCTNDHLWVEYAGSAKPGDRWVSNSVVTREDLIDEAELRRLAAQAQITSVYPLWMQINILREGNATTIANMGRYVDACRDWSNSGKGGIDELEKIER